MRIGVFLVKFGGDIEFQPGTIKMVIISSQIALKMPKFKLVKILNLLRMMMF